MRILILGLNFSPELTGIGQYTGQMAEFLSDQGHELHVVTTPPYYPQWRVDGDYRWWRYRQEERSGIRITRCPLWVPRSPTGWKRVVHLSSFALSSLPAVLSQVKWKPDLVMAIAPAILSAPNAVLIAKMTGAKSWLHIQDFELEAGLQLGILSTQRSLRRCLSVLEARLLGAFDVVSTISHRMCDRLRDKGVSEKNIVFLPNWVDPDRLYPLDRKANALRRELGVGDDNVVVLYSGSMGRKQGIELLIGVAQALDSCGPEIVMVICGDGPGLSALKRVARDHANIRFLGLQPEDRLNELLNLSDIHLLPQRKEASDLVMPSKLLGMMASGRPSIIAAPGGSEMAAVATEAGLLVPPGDPQAIADAILRLAGNPDERRKMGETARSYVLQNRSRHTVLAQFEANLKELVASSSPKGSSQETVPPQR